MHLPMGRICEGPVVSNLFNLLSKEDHFGRPKKKMTREAGEPAGRRAGISKQCRSCGQIGHNKRNCKGHIGGNYFIPSTTNRTTAAKKVTFYYIC